jgi:DNA-directed RNA polymerase specialized sigma24 family protein
MEDLVSRAVARDVAAFSQLARRHQSAVRGLLLRLTRGNHAAADDLAQETFLEAWRDSQLPRRVPVLDLALPHRLFALSDAAAQAQAR